MRIVKRPGSAAVFFFATGALLLTLGVPGSQAQGGASTVPSFTFDATWPKLPLPNKWTFGGVTGLAIDNDDLIWVLHRPNDLNEAENFAALDPPQAECCVMAPAVLAFDRDGNLVHSWDSPQGHMILVDDKDQVWVGSDTFRIHDKQGTLLGALPSAPRLAAPPGGGPRPPQPAYPPDIDVIARGIEGAAFDEAAREVYLVDNYMAGRVMVFDMDQYTFKRGWGAYGKALEDIAPTPRPDFDPSVPLTNYQDFLGHVTIALEGNDVYVADRPANRVQVFTKQGEFVPEFQVAPETLGDGSTGGLAPYNKDSRFLFVSDIMNNVVWIVNPQDGATVGRIGYLGRNGGGFNALHMIDFDSSGNLYTGEVDPNNRVQRFLVGN